MIQTKLKKVDGNVCDFASGHDGYNPIADARVWKVASSKT